jgi:hypothetical protein
MKARHRHATRATPYASVSTKSASDSRFCLQSALLVAAFLCAAIAVTQAMDVEVSERAPSLELLLFPL